MSSPSFLCVPYRYKPGTLYSQVPSSGLGDFVVSRSASNAATRVNAQGFIETVADNVPRLDYPIGGIANGCPALLVEPAATNQIRNNSMVGAVAGSPGTLPTGGGWSSVLIGLTQTIVGVGAENGISYIDINFSGTATLTNALEIRYENTTQIDALNGQAWTHSVYLKKIADPNPPANYRLNIYERTSGGSYVANGESTIVPTTTIQRFTQTRTLSGGATVAKVQPTLFCGVVSGSTYDFTIRIGYPQMELGSVATSVIPTTTTGITRGADVINKTGVSGLIGQTEGTMYAEVDLRNRVGDKNAITISVSSNQSFSIRITPTGFRIIYRNGGSGTELPNLTFSNTAAGIFKMAFAYADGNYSFAVNGSVNTSSTASIFPVGTFSNVEVGSVGNAVFLNDRIRAAALYTTRLTNAELQVLTT